MEFKFPVMNGHREQNPMYRNQSSTPASAYNYFTEQASGAALPRGTYVAGGSGSEVFQGPSDSTEVIRLACPFNIDGAIVDSATALPRGTYVAGGSGSEVFQGPSDSTAVIRLELFKERRREETIAKEIARMRELEANGSGGAVSPSLNFSRKNK